MQAIEQMSPPTLAAKTAMPIDAEDTTGAEADELATTMSEIDRLISDVVAEENVAAATDKGKRIEERIQRPAFQSLGIPGKDPDETDQPADR